jgi:hypothetical protein
MRDGWDRWIGPEGGFVGMTGFGASAPYKTLYKHFGITAEAVVKAAKELRVTGRFRPAHETLTWNCAIFTALGPRVAAKIGYYARA